jgi:hypothetical protein
MSLLHRHKVQCAKDRDSAREKTVARLRPRIGVDFRLSGWNNQANRAFTDQWLPAHCSTGWDWPEVFRRHNDADRLDAVIWGPQDRLCGLALGTLTAEALEIRFLEGDPRADCPLTGRRALIILECAACYVQARGRSEIRVRPANERLEALYVQIYGFSLATEGQGRAYYFKRV